MKEKLIFRPKKEKFGFVDIVILLIILLLFLQAREYRTAYIQCLEEKSEMSFPLNISSGSLGYTPPSNIPSQREIMEELYLKKINGSNRISKE